MKRWIHASDEIEIEEASLIEDRFGSRPVKHYFLASPGWYGYGSYGSDYSIHFWELADGRGVATSEYSGDEEYSSIADLRKDMNEMKESMIKEAEELYDDGELDEAELEELLSYYNKQPYLNIYRSDRSHSIYFSFVKHDEYANKDYKYAMFVRISDHAISDRSKGARQKHYNEEADKLKQPQSKKKQTWKFKDVIVNKESFSSYDDAFDEIRRRLDNLK